MNCSLSRQDKQEILGRLRGNPSKALGIDLSEDQLSPSDMMQMLHGQTSLVHIRSRKTYLGGLHILDDVQWKRFQALTPYLPQWSMYAKWSREVDPNWQTYALRECATPFQRPRLGTLFCNAALAFSGFGVDIEIEDLQA